MSDNLHVQKPSCLFDQLESLSPPEITGLVPCKDLKAKEELSKLDSKGSKTSGFAMV